MTKEGIAAAETKHVGPGETLTLDADLVLQPGDDFVAEGTADNPCQIDGQTHEIATAEGWQGNFTLAWCQVKATGSAMAPALKLHVGGTGNVKLTNNTIDTSGQIVVSASDDADVSIIGNTIPITTAVVISQTSAESSQPAFILSGGSTSKQKLFQGNRIFASYVSLQSSRNWLIGGSNPGEGNILVGRRSGFQSINAEQIHVIGNYVRNVGPLDNWNQVKTFAASGGSVLVEHNVFRGGNWLLDITADAEIRYNLIADSYERPWLIAGGTDNSISVHHNVFTRTDPNQQIITGVQVLHSPGKGKTELFNNTFYGGGKCWQKLGPGLEVYPGSFLESLRSNAFVQIPADEGDATAIIRGAGPTRLKEANEPAYEPLEPPLLRLGYADYNLFFNPDAVRKDNYGLGVMGATERETAGFALHDAPEGGKLDAQSDPKFTGRIPIAFPYKEEDILAGATSVCQVLAFYRRIMAPAEGSPLIDAGDPMEGPGNDIGAIGVGTPNALDLFGSLCPALGEGSPDLGEQAFKCTRTLVVSGPQGTPPEPGFICVCDVSAPPDVRTLVIGVGLGGLALIRRRRRTARRPSP